MWLSLHLPGRRPQLLRLGIFIGANLLVAALYAPLWKLPERIIVLLRQEHGMHWMTKPDDALFSWLVWGLTQAMHVALWSLLSFALLWSALWLFGKGARPGQMAHLVRRFFWGVFLAQSLLELLWVAQETAFSAWVGWMLDLFGSPSPFEGVTILLFALGQWAITCLGFGLIAALWRRLEEHTARTRLSEQNNPATSAS